MRMDFPTAPLIDSTHVSFPQKRNPALPRTSQGSQLRDQSSRQQLFAANAPLVLNFAKAYRAVCPTALVAVYTQPVEQSVVLCNEFLKSQGAYHEQQILGVATLDVVRASTLVGLLCQLDLADVSIQVAGGVGDLSVPLLHSSVPEVGLTDTEVQDVVAAVQNAHVGSGGASLTAAYALARFAEACIMALSGDPGVSECAFVAVNRGGLPYGTREVQLGRYGV